MLWSRVLVAALLLAVGSQCAFINTFYNAKRAFVAGSRLHRRQMRGHPDSLVAPTGDALKNYERTIAKCQKVLDVYRKRKRWHDNALYYAGLSYYYKLEMPSAIRQFRNLQEEWPESEFVPQSYMFMARAYLHEERYDKAEETFALILERYPELNRNEEVSLLQAKLVLRREGKAQAIELLEAVRNSVTSVERKIELTLQMAALYMDLERYDKAMELLSACPRKRKSPDLMYRVDFALLTCHIERDSFDAALELDEAMLDEKSYQFHEAELFLAMADILICTGNFERAIEVCERVTARYSKSAEAGLAWFRLGEIYFRHLIDYTKAKECYDEAVAAAQDSSIVDLARKLASALAAVDTLRQHHLEPVDSVDSAKTDAEFNLALGELFWLELGQADSAFARYQLILDDSTASEEMVAKSLFAAGYISLHGKADSTVADSFFTALIAQFPSSRYSKRAQIEQGKRVTIQTREDSALVAFLEAERIYFEKRDAVKSAESYLRVYNDYADCDIAPQSLYAAAWLMDNVTFSKGAAQFLYKKVCDKFPESSYCLKSARPRLSAAMDSISSVQKRREPKGDRDDREDREDRSERDDRGDDEGRDK